MTMLSRLQKAWTRLMAAEMERVICPECAEWFYRVRVAHPDACCPACRDRQMDAWITNYEARQAINGSRIRNAS